MIALRVVIADDEPLARQRLRSLLQRDPELAIVGECGSGKETLDALERTRPDILFLDVLMPGADGLSILERIPPDLRPHVVLVTAHNRFAVRAFDVHAVDYLLKPYDDERFGVALERAKTAVRHRSGDALIRALGILGQAHPDRSIEHIPVRGPRGTTLLPIDSIDWVESADNYVQMHAGRERHLVRSTLAEIERKLSTSEFARVHRRAIVNLRRVREFRPSNHGDFRIVLRNGATVPLSRRYRLLLEKRLGIEL